MGRLVEAFKTELVRAKYVVLHGGAFNGPRPATTNGLPSSVREEFLDLFRALGGTVDWGDFKSGQWDMVTADGLLIEFDEQLHFNRYRLITDDVTWSEEIPWSKEYLHYSSAHEDWCWKDGRRGKTWTSPATEKMFGEADPPGVFELHGSPRWKQRALYDAVKDAYAVHTPGISMARVSLYDQIGGTDVHRLLKRGVSLDPAALRDFVAARTIR